MLCWILCECTWVNTFQFSFLLYSLQQHRILVSKIRLRWLKIESFTIYTFEEFHRKIAKQKIKLSRRVLHFIYSQKRSNRWSNQLSLTRNNCFSFINIKLPTANRISLRKTMTFKVMTFNWCFSNKTNLHCLLQLLIDIYYFYFCIKQNRRKRHEIFLVYDNQPINLHATNTFSSKIIELYIWCMVSPEKWQKKYTKFYVV